MNGSAMFNGLAHAARTLASAVAPIARPATVMAAGYLAGGLGAQFGPWAVKAVVNHTTSGYFARFFYQQSLNAAFGQYYYPAGQLLGSSIAAVCPGPGKIAETIHKHCHHRNYQAELRRIHFDGSLLKVKETEDGFMKCSYKVPVDLSTYSIIDKKEADSLPKLPMLASGKCDQFEMNTYKAAITDGSGVEETVL
ncbi:hypothetical protein [Endozoicomonas sp. SCSIO W0465]|uniref:hypothetical protein n=1 Tax=Endozoicomonas sp. SCSIO W0465 TaxID=2918516 RepID=UPI00207618AA|nr:hypothetical protein [Endozoicomonas sp. SCSIO W0465]USE35351.1 hypothetical protein MJO57_25135 [Endozoicomonas sp. SCSIO W0465]